jgi:hypothetical protein
MHFSPINQNGWTDAYVYTGYIHNFVDLFDRYGTTYYGVRFGMIMPAQIAAVLFGPIGGYFALRYVLVLITGIPFYALVKQRYGLAVAISSFGLLVTSPLLARSILWDYTDASGVAFLFAAICLFSIEHRRRTVLDACAGVCAGLSLHSNVFSLAPLGIYLGAYAVAWVWGGRGVLSGVRRLATLAVGIAAITLVGVSYYWWRVGRADIFSVTIEAALGLAGWTMERWRLPGVSWIARQWATLFPVALAVPMTLAWSWRRTSHEAIVWLGLIGTATFYAVSQFLLRGNVQQLSYYFSYTIPIVFLAMASVIAWLSAGEGRSRWAGGALLLAAVVPWVLVSFDLGFLVPPAFVWHATVLATALALCIVVARSRRPATTLTAGAALGFAFFSSLAHAPYTSMVQSRLTSTRPLELDVYRVAVQFMRHMPALAAEPGAILFWHRDVGGESLQSIQSTYLWAYSRLQGQDQGRGMPYLGAVEINRIFNPAVTWLALLAEREEELAGGRSALVAAGISGTIVSHRTLTSDNYTMHLELLRLPEGRIAKPTEDTAFGPPLILVTDQTPQQVNVYGRPPGHLAADGNRVTFVPTDARDHVAYPFAALPHDDHDRQARVVVETREAAAPSCQLVVQAEGFHDLATLGCSTATQYVVIPPETKALRIYLADQQRRPFVLPRRIELALPEPSK